MLLGSRVAASSVLVFALLTAILVSSDFSSSSVGKYGTSTHLAEGVYGHSQVVGRDVLVVLPQVQRAVSSQYNTVATCM